MHTTAAMLVLEDGSAFPGESMGAEGEWVGEVVFNTSMTGYQEIITDPSYWGQMVCFTCPHIGNVGVNAEDVESRQPYARAVLARQICEAPSNWRAQRALPDYLRAHGVPAFTGLDTRRLTLTLRQKGALRGALSTADTDVVRLHAMARAAADMSALAPWAEVTSAGATPWGEGIAARWAPDAPTPDGPAPHVVVLDFGIKRQIMRHLRREGARVTALPWDAAPEVVLAQRPDGLLLSNGPADPRAVPAAVLGQVRRLLERVPTLGICLGHQIVALAAGARIYK
ncbi:MAG: carbamoyl phosphate synthase small subunit, partial [Chloroflexota bacterium]